MNKLLLPDEQPLTVEEIRAWREWQARLAVLRKYAAPAPRPWWARLWAWVRGLQ